MNRCLTLLACLLLSQAAAAQQPAPAEPRILPAEEALAEDGAEYARRFSVPLDEAIRRLRAQEDSVAATNRIRRDLAARLAGISIEHSPEYRIVVLLTGNDGVAAERVKAGGLDLPIVYRTGARATREQIVKAMLQHRLRLERELPGSRGMGLDQRSGELILLVTGRTAARMGAETIRARAEAITGVPVRIEIADPPAANLSVKGGARLVGMTEGRRYACTSGFVVRRGEDRGIVTAAHCPDSLTYLDPDGSQLQLGSGSQWGVGRHDVQIHVAPEADRPLFYSDRRKGSLRRLVSWRNRTSTRGGDFVCKWGESSGYGCSEVDLTDYAPPVGLCGGPCEPMWVTVKGPQCRAGDSGGPVFIGGTAFGITKGGSGITARCNFFYYMSTDLLPDGWGLLHDSPSPRRRVKSSRRP